MTFELSQDIVEILVTSGHVCLYWFDVDGKTWVRKVALHLES